MKHESKNAHHHAQIGSVAMTEDEILAAELNDFAEVGAEEWTSEDEFAELGSES